MSEFGALRAGFLFRQQDADHMLWTKGFGAQGQYQGRVDAAADADNRALAVQRLVHAVAQLLHKSFGFLHHIDIQRLPAEGGRNLGSDGLIHRAISS